MAVFIIRARYGGTATFSYSSAARFAEEFLTNDAGVRGLMEKGRGYTREGQDLMGRKQLT